jgi:hypothetical protein
MRTTVAVLVAAITGEHPYAEVNANGWGLRMKRMPSLPSDATSSWHLLEPLSC